MTNPCRDENECNEILAAAIDDYEARWHLGRLARTVMQVLALRQIGVDPAKAFARELPAEEEMLVPFLLYHMRFRERTIAEAVNLDLMPMCGAVREWIEVETRARLSYWVVAASRRKTATLVDVMWGEEIEALIPRSMKTIVGQAIFGRVVRHGGIDSFGDGWSMLLTEEEARCAALEARNTGVGPVEKRMLYTWVRYCERAWKEAVC